jgi:hypothetical protein
LLLQNFEIVNKNLKWISTEVRNYEFSYIIISAAYDSRDITVAIGRRLTYFAYSYILLFHDQNVYIKS